MKTNEKLKNIEKEMNTFFMEREDSIRGLILAVLSGNNILLLGPPGVAKSLVVRSWQQHIPDTKYFEYLLNKYSTPEDVIGTLSLGALEQDRFLRITTDKLPDAQVGFLDEIFKCNVGTLNALLPLLNERKFHNDGKVFDVPLLTVVGASNEIPDSDDGLDALYDRFLLKYKVNPIKEEGNFKRMIEGAYEFVPKTKISMSEVLEAVEMVKKVRMNEGMTDLLVKLRRILARKGIKATDRTYKICKRILQAQAYLSGREEILEEDFTVLRHVLWSDPDDERVVLSTIFDLVSPEMGQIVDLFEKTKEIADNAMAEEDEKKRMDKGIDAAGNIKVLRTKIADLIETMKKKGKDVTEAEKYSEKLDEMFRTVFKKSIGMGYLGGESK